MHNTRFGAQNFGDARECNFTRSECEPFPPLILASFASSPAEPGLRPPSHTPRRPRPARCEETKSIRSRPPGPSESTKHDLNSDLSLSEFRHPGDPGAAPRAKLAFLSKCLIHPGRTSRAGQPGRVCHSLLSNSGGCLPAGSAGPCHRFSQLKIRNATFRHGSQVGFPESCRTVGGTIGRLNSSTCRLTSTCVLHLGRWSLPPCALVGLVAQVVRGSSRRTAD